MKEYWFYLETYVFIWSNSQEILIYNSLSGKGYLYCHATELKSIVTRLEDTSNLYCITINEIELKNSVIHDFISSVRENLCGDLLDRSIYKQKPLVVIPKLNVNEEVFIGGITVKRDFVSGIHAVKNLLELTIYLTGMCHLECKDCHYTYRQISWCYKNEHILPKDLLFDILAQTKGTSVCEVKFLGGNVFSYPYWDELIDELRKYSFKKSFYIDFRLLSSIQNQLDIFKVDGFSLWILVGISDNMKQINIGEIPVCQQYNYLYKVKSIEEYEIAQSIVDLYQIESKIIPFYEDTNLQFFKDNIFQNIEEILDTHWSRNEIFSHTVLNTNFFGKFTILSNGKIYSNIHSEPIGDVKSDNIKVLVSQELKHGKLWLLTRNKIIPCKNCLYKYLCPSLSDYEIAIGQNNLCHVRP